MVQIRNLSKYYSGKKGGFLQKPSVVRALDGISLDIAKGTTMGLVGESGSGKTTAARSILRLIEPDNGSVLLDGTDVLSLKREELRAFRKKVQIVFQDPYSSLNPRLTVEKIIAEPLKIHTNLSKEDIQERVRELLKITGLKEEHAVRYPHEFSGGQRQRIGIARAIALNPLFIILDEPVSALDVSIQAQILNLLMDLQKRLDITYLFVAHDLAVVEHVSDRVAVMYLGKIVEENSASGLYSEPLHPYTSLLLKSVPEVRPSRHGFSVPPGEIPSPENPPAGCHFHPRCPRAMDICSKEYPEFRYVGSCRVACHLYSSD